MSGTAANTQDPTDLATYKPATADDLAKGLGQVALTAAAGSWNAIKTDVLAHLTLIATLTLSTKDKLAAGSISEKDADHTLSLLQLNLNSTVLEADMVPYVVGQKVLNAVFAVVAAVVKNYTGIALNF
jgi:hypothetical protein